MAQSAFTYKRKLFTATAVAAAGGTMTCDFPIPIDKGARLEAFVFLSSATASHLSNFGSIRAEYVVENKNGTLSAPATITGSTNPLNSNTAGEASAHVQATDAAFTNPGGGTTMTAVWTISTTNARLTVTNNSVTSIAANVTVEIVARIVGST